MKSNLTEIVNMIGACLSTLFFLASDCALAQSVATLPAPIGPYTIGRTSLHWKDNDRYELETSSSDDKRELIVHLFYPAEADPAGSAAVYLPDADVMQGIWNESQLARIKAMRTHSHENAPIAIEKMRYPVVLFSPGGAFKVLTYQVLLEDLASYGWIVAAIDPPYNARAMRLPDGRVLGNLQPNERGWQQPRNEEENRQFYKERILHWSRDVTFVIDQLSRLDKGDGKFAKRLDLERGVGIFGHSRGGQVAATSRILDKRIQAGINIDGMFDDFAVIPVNEDDNAVGTQPFLWIQKPLPPPPTDEQIKRAGRTREDFEANFARIMNKWQRQLGGIENGAMRLTLNRPSITHIDFSDEPYWDGTMTDANRPGRLQTVADTRNWVRAFFSGTICGEWEELKNLVNDEAKTNVTLHPFRQLWPQ